MKYLWVIAAITLFGSCGNKQAAPSSKKIYFDVNGMLDSQISILTAGKTGVEKVVDRESEPEQQDQDSVKWKEELDIFRMLDLNKVGLEGKYDATSAKNGDLEISSWEAKDTNMEVQHLSVNLKKGKLQVLEGVIKIRSFMVDRDIRLNFMPGKGYGLKVSENYLWKKPSEYEIFATIKNPDLLYR